jgi:hypothetical protein
VPDHAYAGLLNRHHRCFCCFCSKLSAAGRRNPQKLWAARGPVTKKQRKNSGGKGKNLRKSAIPTCIRRNIVFT